MSISYQDEAPIRSLLLLHLEYIIPRRSPYQATIIKVPYQAPHITTEDAADKQEQEAADKQEQDAADKQEQEAADKQEQDAADKQEQDAADKQEQEAAG